MCIMNAQDYAGNERPQGPEGDEIMDQAYCESFLVVLRAMQR